MGENSRRWTFDDANTMIQSTNDSEGHFQNCFFTYTYYSQNSEIHFSQYDDVAWYTTDPNLEFVCCEPCGDFLPIWGDFTMTIIEHTSNNLICEIISDFEDATIRYHFEKVN